MTGPFSSKMTFFLQILANFTKNNIYLCRLRKKNLFLFQLQICGSSSVRRKKTRCRRMAAILRYLSMTKFTWKLKYMAKYILKAFFLTTFPSTQKKCPKISAVTLVLSLNPLWSHLRKITGRSQGVQ